MWWVEKGKKRKKKIFLGGEQSMYKQNNTEQIQNNTPVYCTANYKPSAKLLSAAA
jgi:hypothetical protein